MHFSPDGFNGQSRLLARFDETAGKAGLVDAKEARVETTKKRKLFNLQKSETVAQTATVRSGIYETSDCLTVGPTKDRQPPGRLALHPEALRVK